MKPELVSPQFFLPVMKLIASKGIAIIFITHRLDEVMAVADSLTVLRDGEFVARREVKDSNVVEIAELMIGRKVEKLVDGLEDEKREVNSKNIALSLKDFHVIMPGEMVRGIDLDVIEGEIFGIGGLAGQGKIGIPNRIMGLYETEGAVTFLERHWSWISLEMPLNMGLPVFLKTVEEWVFYWKNPLRKTSLSLPCR
ncbi:hypothetical protein [Proteiniclasticum sp.]|uniref:hypothetical protein n=1 Tax=Proteiniclasticum sp. TaxID=2053595 RepID=UPI0028A0B258|nr:hypothetical protein [Proteiniclasticum sp.]